MTKINISKSLKKNKVKVRTKDKKNKKFKSDLPAFLKDDLIKILKKKNKL